MKISRRVTNFSKQAMQLLGLIAISLCFVDISAQAIGTIDRLTGLRVTKPWLEAGFTLVDDSGWINVRSVGKAFTTNIVILTALPDLGGRLYTEGNATATRIRNIASNSSGVFFEIKVSSHRNIRFVHLTCTRSINLKMRSATKLPLDVL
jgi:hypothetical protein